MDNNKNDKKLLLKVLIRGMISIPVVGLMIFLPAGTFNYPNGWLFLAVIFIPMIFALRYLYKNDPELLEKRMRASEKQKSQKLLQKVFFPLFLLPVTLPGFDFRFGWSNVPLWLVIMAILMVIDGYILFVYVMKQNSYASRVVEIQNEQKVIDTGLYGIVRHPMYLAILIMYTFYPLVLGSFYGLISSIVIPLVLVLRIIDEERLLIKELPGYLEYTKKVKFRMIPYIW